MNADVEQISLAENLTQALEMLLKLEDSQFGTLKIASGASKGTITVSQSHIISASYVVGKKTSSGPAALETLLKLSDGVFQFIPGDDMFSGSVREMDVLVSKLLSNGMNVQDATVEAPPDAVLPGEGVAAVEQAQALFSTLDKANNAIGAKTGAQETVEIPDEVYQNFMDLLKNETLASVSLHVAITDSNSPDFEGPNNTPTARKMILGLDDTAPQQEASATASVEASPAQRTQSQHPSVGETNKQPVTGNTKAQSNVDFSPLAADQDRQDTSETAWFDPTSSGAHEDVPLGKAISSLRSVTTAKAVPDKPATEKSDSNQPQTVSQGQPTANIDYNMLDSIPTPKADSGSTKTISVSQNDSQGLKPRTNSSSQTTANLKAKENAMSTNTRALKSKAQHKPMSTVTNSVMGAIVDHQGPLISDGMRLAGPCILAVLMLALFMVPPMMKEASSKTEAPAVAHEQISLAIDKEINANVVFANQDPSALEEATAEEPSEPSAKKSK